MNSNAKWNALKEAYADASGEMVDHLNLLWSINPLWTLGMVIGQA